MRREATPTADWGRTPGSNGYIDPEGDVNMRGGLSSRGWSRRGAVLLMLAVLNATACKSMEKPPEMTPPENPDTPPEDPPP